MLMLLAPKVCVIDEFWWWLSWMLDWLIAGVLRQESRRLSGRKKAVRRRTTNRQISPDASVQETTSKAAKSGFCQCSFPILYWLLLSNVTQLTNISVKTKALHCRCKNLRKFRWAKFDQLNTVCFKHFWMTNH